MAFGNAQSATGSDTTPTVTKPTGTASNDIVIAANTYDSSSLTNAWNNSLTNLRQDTNTLDGQRTASAWKRAGGAEPSSYTSTINSAVSWAIGALNLTGRSTSSDPEISSASVNNSGNSSPVTLTANGVTALAGDDLVWIAASDCTDTAGPNVFTPPTGYTTRVDVEGAFTRLMIATQDNVSAGATGTVSGSLTLSAGTAAWAAQLIRVPAAAGGADVLMSQACL